MNAPVTVEPFSPRYADAIFDLILPIQAGEFGIEITREDQPDLARIPQYYQMGNGNFWIAREDDAVVGTIALLDIWSRQMALRKMFVRADRRGKEHGVARQLLTDALAWAKKSHALDIYLGTTAQFQAAHRFYEKNGFAEIGRGKLPPRFPVMEVDSKFYHRAVA